MKGFLYIEGQVLKERPVIYDMINMYKLGLLQGRFQHIHMGHQMLIEKMLKECDRVLILVGGAQYLGEKRNPFNHIIRQKLIKKLYPQKKVIVGFYPDLPYAKKDSEYARWGDWIMEHARIFAGIFPDAVYSGHRTKNELIYRNFPKLKFNTVNRTQDSGGEVRKLLNFNRQEEWKSVTDERLHTYYQVLKGIVEGKISPYITDI